MQRGYLPYIAVTIVRDLQFVIKQSEALATAPISCIIIYEYLFFYVIGLNMSHDVAKTWGNIRRYLTVLKMCVIHSFVQFSNKSKLLN